MKNFEFRYRRKNFAFNFLSPDYKPHTPVTRVVDQGEPSEFKSLFKGWREKDQTVGMGRTYSGTMRKSKDPEIRNQI